MSTENPKLPSDDWDKPAPPLGDGLRKGPPLSPPTPKLEFDQSDAPLPEDVIELREIVKGLKRDNQVLMTQIEEAWAVIKSRDETIQYLQEGR